MGQQGFEFLQFDRGRIFERKPGPSAELFDKREQRAVPVVGRAKIAQAEIPLALEALRQLRGQARFAETRFASDQNDLAVLQRRVDQTSPANVTDARSRIWRTSWRAIASPSPLLRSAPVEWRLISRTS